MSSLREIKDHIASVKSTLKITSAMKLVSSSKLRKAQKAIESMRPYEETLSDIFASLQSPGDLNPAGGFQEDFPADSGKSRKATAVVAIASNSSLCGAFNANVTKKALEIANEYSSEGEVRMFGIGRRTADSLKKAGYPSEADYSSLVAHPSYDESSALSRDLCERFFGGKLSRVILVYNHFVSTSHQEVVCREFLPFHPIEGRGPGALPEDFIVEPSASEVVKTLLPQVLSLRFFAALLDSCAAEHAARTIAMQTASDNASELLEDMTLEYNKGRQQKITSEILDIVGGSIR